MSCLQILPVQVQIQEGVFIGGTYFGPRVVFRSPIQWWNPLDPDVLPTGVLRRFFQFVNEYSIPFLENRTYGSYMLEIIARFIEQEPRYRMIL